MLIEDMAKALFVIGKRHMAVNHQDNKLIRDAALALQKLDQENRQLRERVYELEERIAIMTEADEVVEADPEWPPIDEDGSEEPVEGYPDWEV